MEAAVRGVERRHGVESEEREGWRGCGGVGRRESVVSEAEER